MKGFEDAIMEFDGHYRFLSNFYPCKVKHEGIVYPSSEHAYQASKTDNLEARREMAAIKLAANAKKFGRSVRMSAGFEANKVGTMRNIVRKKFVQNPHLLQLLFDTDDCFLVEGNYWGDTFWGVTHEGHGLNHLGHILMQVREELRG